MLRIRELHENEAQRKLREAEQQRDQAEEKVKEASKVLDDFRKWRPEEEERRYAAIFGKKLSPTDLGNFREGLKGLDLEEENLQSNVLKAEQNLAKSQELVEQARQKVVLTRKETLKLEEHRKIWTTEQRKAEERLSDLEMEETKGPAKMTE